MLSLQVPPHPFCFIHKRSVERDDSSARVKYVNCSLFIAAPGSCSRPPCFPPCTDLQLTGFTRMTLRDRGNKWLSPLRGVAVHIKYREQNRDLVTETQFPDWTSSTPVYIQVQNHHKLLTPSIDKYACTLKFQIILLSLVEAQCTMGYLAVTLPHK